MKCERHNKPLEAYCESDDVLLCVNCLIESQHKTHSLSAIDCAAKQHREVLSKEIANVCEKEILLSATIAEIETRIKIQNDTFNEEINKSKKFFTEIKSIINEYESGMESKYKENNMKIVEYLNKEKNSLDLLMKDIEYIKKENDKKLIDEESDVNFLMNGKRIKLILSTLSTLSDKSLHERLNVHSNEDAFTINKNEVITNIIEKISKLKIENENFRKTFIKSTKTAPVKSIDLTNVPKGDSNTFNFVSDSARNNAIKQHHQLFPVFKTSSSNSHLISHNHLHSLNLTVSVSNNSMLTNAIDSIDKSAAIKRNIKNKSPTQFGTKSKVTSPVMVSITNQVTNIFKRNTNDYSDNINGNNKEIVNSSFLSSSISISKGNITSLLDNNIDSSGLYSLYNEIDYTIYLIGGKSDNVTRKFSTDTFQWTKSNINVSLSDFVVVQYKDKKALILGGKSTHGANPEIKDSVMLVNFAKGEIDKLDFRLKKNRISFGGAYVLNKLYIFGGTDTRYVFDDIECFDIKKKKWKELAKMSKKRKDFAYTSTPDNSIYVIGGQDEKDIVLRSIERFDVVKSTWNKVRDMNQKRKGATAICMPDGIIVIGGFDGVQYLKSVEKYDFISKKWTYMKDMKVARCYLSSAPSSDFRYIYVFGGYNGKPISSVERFDVIENKWEIVTEMPTTKYKHCCLFVKE